MAGAALESPLLKAPLAGRDSSKSHPVLAGRAGRPLGNRNDHHSTPTINDRGSEEFWSVRLPTLGQNFDASLASQEPRAVFERGGIVAPNWWGRSLSIGARGRDQRSKPLGASRIVKESPPVYAGRLFLANETKFKRRKGQPIEYRYRFFKLSWRTTSRHRRRC